MDQEAQREAMELYAALMEEVKIRVAIIDAAVNKKIPLGAVVLQELCYLQLRMICEVVALGCLVAHGDIEGRLPSGVRKMWKADKIIGILQGLHGNFYPTPYVPTPQDPNNPRHHHYDMKDSGFLTKGELVSLIHKSGEKLHRGNLNTLLSDEEQPQPDFIEITQATRRIVELLKTHTLFLADNQTAIICVMEEPPARNVRVFIAKGN